MKKTTSIHLAGQLFSIDEEACRILADYLEHVAARFRNEPGGEETITDIETRIAEIFGGGQEPPLLVSRDMVQRMIEVMGAPEEYAAAAEGEVEPAERKPLYDPRALRARAGKTLAGGWHVIRILMAALLRILAVLLGTMLTIFGFLSLFIFTLIFFFNHSPMVTGIMEPNLVNTPMLLEMVLNPPLVRPVLLLTALAVLIPLAVMTYIGVKLIFRLGAISKLVKVLVFVVWIAAVCGTVVLISLQVSAYGHHARVVEKVQVRAPLKTLWIAPLHKLSGVAFDDMAAVDGYTFRRQSATGQLFGTAELDIYGSDTSAAWISVEKMGRSNSAEGARSNARKVDYHWKISRDTLYLDEYFSLPAGAPWNGSSIDIDVWLPEGTMVRLVPGAVLSTWHVRCEDPAATRFRIRAGSLEELTGQ
ncbi:MAG TPA: hypothetical protein PKI62_09640 [bacterium]|nr:hypothetical protein [bacterium]